MVGEIDEGFGGVIPSGVFEIDVAEAAIGLSEGVVKAEIGW